MSGGHTPLPWSIYADDKAVIRTNQNANSFRDEPDNEWIDCNTAEDAAFVLRAVNSHYELLEALELIEPHLDAIICHASTMSEYEPNRIAKKVSDAIAKARGETP